tara:strand:+ start:5894 stop:6103 length:210 start_codon:yes stop_codon:yes gene_type:complete
LQPTGGTLNKSTGPSWAAGKTVSSGNSLKHGVLSQRAVANREDREAYDALLAQLIEDHVPETSFECTLT